MDLHAKLDFANILFCRYLQNTVGRSRGRRRFIAYSCIGWGVPLLAVLICVVLDLKYGLYG